MVDEPRVDELLDEWENLWESNPQMTPEQFIEDHLDGADSNLVEAFRHQAEQLATIDHQMELVAGPLPTAAQNQRCDDDLRLSSLKPGLEPIPGYTLVSRLGGGGFGEVWKAKSPGGFHVALKFVQLGGRVGDVEERSLEVIKDVRHPHLLSVFGTWCMGDLLIIATELADRTLLDRFDEARKEGHEGIPKDELLVYLAEAAKGIDALNDPGSSRRMRIQHRDIKPQNLLLSGGSVKVGDFGLARSIQYDVTGHTGSLTFAYAAPECFDGATSNRSDQYSLAITYCHLRGGRLPFDGTQVEVMDGHRKKQPDLSMIPADERPAIAKALAKLPKNRWKSCAEFVRHLGLSEDVGTSRSVHTSAMKDGHAYRTGLMVAVVVIPLLILLAWYSSPRDTVPQTPTGTVEGASIRDNGHDAMSENEARPRIAVLYFENQSPDRKELDALAKGLCSMMITRLDAKKAQYDIVERERLEVVLNELDLTRSAKFDQRQVAQIGKLIGARQLVLGSYFQLSDVLRIDARLVNVETGVTIAAAGVEGKPDDFSSLLGELVDQLSRKYVQASDGSQDQEATGRLEDDSNVTQISVHSAVMLGVAVDNYDRGDVGTAVAAVDKIVEANPLFVEAKELRTRWTASPQDSKSEVHNEQ